MSDIEQEQDNDINQLSEDDIEEEVEDVTIKVKLDINEIFEELEALRLNQRHQFLAYMEKKKEFDKYEKEFYLSNSRACKEIDNSEKKFKKSLKIESNKHIKVRKTGNSGQGGFNKLIIVPSRIREYLNITEDTLLSRPQVTKRLNAKFIEDKFRDGKTITITNKKVAKILGCEHNLVIPFDRFQTFIKGFYENEKSNNVEVN